MAKKFFLTMFIITFCTGVIFAQDGAANDADAQKEKAKAYNTITFDAAPVALGFTAPELLKIFVGDQISGTYGFGFGVQYERNYNDSFSFAWRFAYMGFGTGLSFSMDNISVSGIDISTFTIETHARIYPADNVFFLGGLIGYTFFNLGMDGSAVFTDYLGTVYNENFSLSVTRHSIKIGGRLGWRIRLGKNRGFTFEPSIGYDIGFAFGDSVGSQFIKGVTSGVALPVPSGAANKAGVRVDGLGELEEIFQLPEVFLIAGGPRMSFLFGWSF